MLTYLDKSFIIVMSQMEKCNLKLLSCSMQIFIETTAETYAYSNAEIDNQEVMDRTREHRLH